MYYCMFEQSGTFKNEFIKLGYKAVDLDILNGFNQTDYVLDIYNEISLAYEGKKSIFDNITSEDTILAFFPCTRFENQIIMWFQGNNYGQRSWTLKQKLEYDIKLQNELSNNYILISKLVIVCLNRNLKLIIENPYCTSKDSYLTRYWCIKPSIIDMDRSLTGDYFEKPTQYFFINCEPKNNFIFEGVDIKKKKIVKNVHNKVNRSMISPDYANRFIREFIL